MFSWILKKHINYTVWGPVSESALVCNRHTDSLENGKFLRFLPEIEHRMTWCGPTAGIQMKWRYDHRSWIGLLSVYGSSIGRALQRDPTCSKPRKTFFSGYFRNGSNCDSTGDGHIIISEIENLLYLWYVQRMAAWTKYLSNYVFFPKPSSIGCPVFEHQTRFPYFDITAFFQKTDARSKLMCQILSLRFVKKRKKSA